MSESTSTEAFQGGCLFGLCLVVVFLTGIVVGPIVMTWVLGVCR